MKPTQFLIALAVGTTATFAQSPCGIVADTYPGTTGSRCRNLVPAFGGSLLYSALDATDWGLYRTWGNGQVQLLLRQPRADEPMVECSTPQGSRVFFVARDPNYGVELHCTDGTPGGTHMVKDIRPGGLGSSFGAFTPFGDRMLFSCYDYRLGSEPFITDGTAAGTFRLMDVAPGRAHSAPRDFTPAGDYALFVAIDGTTGLELYVTDGTTAGTSLLKDIDPNLSSYPKDLTRLGNKVIFSAYTATAGRELWVSDGTTAGTVMLQDIYPGTNDSFPSQFVELDGKLYFGANDGTRGHELWVTDGTPSGTHIVKDLFPGGFSANVTGLTACDGKIYFAAKGLFQGNRPYVSDGTPGGTFVLVGAHQSYAPIDPREFTAAADQVFFRAGGTLWVTDGTPAGTRTPLAHNAGGPGSPAQFVAVGNGVCFRGTSATMGWELWYSDGTAPNTKPICDLHPGATGSSPNELATSGGKLFFTATSAAHGLEVFSVTHPGATVHSIPGASEPAAPDLSVRGMPYLGGSIRIEASGPTGHLGFLVAGLATDLPRAPIPGLLARGSDWVGALTAASAILAATSNNRLSLPLTVPNVAALDGDRANLQMWWIAPGPLQFSVSNGVQLRLGTRAPR